MADPNGWLLDDATRNRVRAEARRAADSAQPLMGIVTAYDPNQYAARVVLMPEGAFPEDQGNVLETDWIPISTHWSGNGWGLFMPPSLNDQVHVKFVDGEVGSAVIDGRVFDLNHLPLPVPSGEFWLVHQSGSFIKVTNNGQVALQDQHGSSLVFDNAGHAVLTGDLRVTGAIIAGYGGADQVGLQTHTHTQAADSHGDTEQPTAAPTAGT